MDGRDVIARWSAMDPGAMAALDPEGDLAKRHLLNPAVLRMLGDVGGRAVLDAGCGQGYFARMLAARGAAVTGLEPAPGLIGYARAREAELGQGITYVQADLASHRPDPVHDAVVVNMVLITIPDWRAALDTCVAALAPGGRLVVALTHPCFEEGPYFDEHVLDRPVAPDFHRPLSSYLTAIARAGLRIAEVAEPRLDPGTVPDGDAAAERLTREPAFLIVCADRE